MEQEFAQQLVASRAHEASGEIGAALDDAARAFEAARISGNPAATAAARCRVATLHWRLGHFATAHQLAIESLDDTAVTDCHVDALIIAGSCIAALDDLAAAETYLQQAIDLSRQVGYLAGHSQALQKLASHVYLRHGQFSLALSTAEEALQLGPTEQHGPAWLLCAWIYQLTGERIRAYAALDAARRSAPADVHIVAVVHYLAALLALDEHDLGLARQLLDKALLVTEVTGHPLLLVHVRIARSRWHRLNDEGPAAREWADDALAMACYLGSAYLESQALIARGQAVWLLGNLQEAEEDLYRAFRRLDALGAAYDAAHAALLHSALLQAKQHPAAEISWIEAARRIMEGSYSCLLDRERACALPWLAAYLHSQDVTIRTTAEVLVQHVLRDPAPPLHITAMGQFVVCQGKRVIPTSAWEQRKAGELFRFLLVQPFFSTSRDIAIEALWPARQQAAGERLLQQATSVLRHVLEPDLPDKFPSRYLSVADHHLALNLPPGSTLDFCRFEQSLSHAFTESRASLAMVLATYTGDLFFVDRYAEWASGPRERLAKLYERGLLHLAACALEELDPAQALETCDRLLERDPCNEDAVQIAMQVCLSRNDRPGALRRYETLRHALRRDLRLAPRADLRALVEELHKA